MINAFDVGNIYELPLLLHDEGLDSVCLDVLRVDDADIDPTSWTALVDTVEAATSQFGLV